MVHSVELVLDVLLDRHVRAQWAALADARLPSLAGRAAPSHRPHVTLAVADAMPAALDPALVEAVGEALPLRLQLGAVVVFGHRRTVLARLVVPNAALLRVHAAVAAVTAQCPGPRRHLEPGHWTPHVTLARNLRPGQVDPALDALAPVREVDGSAVAVRRWDGDARVEWTVASAPAAPTRGGGPEGPPVGRG